MTPFQAVMERSALTSATSIAVLCAIASYMDTNGTVGASAEHAPTQADYAARARVGQGTFTRHVEAAISAGELRKIVHGNGRGARVEYRLLLLDQPTNDPTVGSLPTESLVDNPVDNPINDPTVGSLMDTDSGNDPTERSFSEIVSPPTPQKRSHCGIVHPQVERTYPQETIPQWDRLSRPTNMRARALFAAAADHELVTELNSYQQQQAAKGADCNDIAALLAAAGLDGRAIPAVIRAARQHYGADAAPAVRAWLSHARASDTVRNLPAFVRSRIEAGIAPPTAINNPRDRPIPADIAHLIVT